MAKDLIHQKPFNPMWIEPHAYKSDTRTWPYSRDLAERIAADVAAGVSIHAQQAMDPLTVPPASVVMTWRKQHPEFGVMMRHADVVRADLLREQALHQADHGSGAAPRIAIQVATRLKMADKLDGGTQGGLQGAMPGSDPQPVALTLSDDELAALALAGAGERVG